MKWLLFESLECLRYDGKCLWGELDGSALSVALALLRSNFTLDGGDINIEVYLTGGGMMASIRLISEVPKGRVLIVDSSVFVS